jgi:transposase
MKSREELLELFRTDPQKLVRHVLDLQGEREQLSQELLQVQGRVEQTQNDLGQTQKDLQQARLDLVEAKAFIAELTRQLFGQKADKLSPEQEEQLKEVTRDLEEESQRPPPISRQCLEEELAGKENQPKERRSRKRHPFPVVLERITVTLEADLPPCPPGGVYRKIGEEVTEELDFIAAKLILKRTVRPKYAASWSEGGIVIAPLPPRLFPQSKLGLGLAVFITLSRFDDHLSYYKLEQNFRERFGVVISRQQMVQWIEQIALWLQPIYNLMWELMKAGDYLQIDETTVKVLDPEVKNKAATGWLWFYSVPGADVIVEFSPSRGQAAPKKRLEGFSGTIQADAYEVYPCIQRDLPGIQRLGCLAHSRRRFYKAALEGDRQAIWFIAQIRRLYRIEKESRQMSPEERRKYREEKRAREIWEEMKARAAELKPQLLPQSSLSKALSYFLEEYEPLLGYLRDGRFEIDNNLCENSIRAIAVGRKRWLFLGHPEAAWRSTVIYSIIMSCRQRGINPQDYLTDVLGRLPSMKASEVIDLVPARWKPKPPNTS